jgi:hypothetical protein
MWIKSPLFKKTNAQIPYTTFQIEIWEGFHNALLGEPIPQVGDVPKEHPF